ncbi:HAD-like domain-containing protein [Mycena epipterygia]|nr:HAD-like domain-containing protein [Mycena epipterygia]
MSKFALADFKVIVFDCYGTLADWETGIFTALQPLLARFPSSATWTRKEALLAFTKIEKDLQAKDPSMLYCELLAKTHELVILSNVDHASFAHTHAKLSQDTELAIYTRPSLNPNAQWLPQITPNSRSPFSLILTAQDTSAYKPDPRGMLSALEIIQKEFGIGKEQVLVVAQSLHADIEPCSKLGVSGVWIDRQGAAMGFGTIGGAPKWRRRFETLGELAAAVTAEEKA